MASGPGGLHTDVIHRPGTEPGPVFRTSPGHLRFPVSLDGLERCSDPRRDCQKTFGFPLWGRALPAPAGLTDGLCPSAKAGKSACNPAGPACRMPLGHRKPTFLSGGKPEAVAPQTAQESRVRAAGGSGDSLPISARMGISRPKGNPGGCSAAGSHRRHR